MPRKNLSDLTDWEKVQVLSNWAADHKGDKTDFLEMTAKMFDARGQLKEGQSDVLNEMIEERSIDLSLYAPEDYCNPGEWED